MTISDVTGRFSFASVLQMAAMLVAAVMLFAFVKFQGEANAAEIEKVSETTSGIATGLGVLAGRVRGLEVREAAVSERLKTVQRDIGDIKRGQQENNRLLRQLLQRGDGQ